jgi:hypothetical protein
MCHTMKTILNKPNICLCPNGLLISTEMSYKTGEFRPITWRTSKEKLYHLDFDSIREYTYKLQEEICVNL